MLFTGAGAPCGILFYEGDLLPEKYHGSIIHADAGPNVVRAYWPHPSEHVARGLFNKDGDENVKESDGAGYKSDFEELIKGGDKWFRPDDVCVAPDARFMFPIGMTRASAAHGTGDTGAKTHNWRTLHGRIYRLAPTGYQPFVPALDIETIPGQIAALESPNLARRYLGYTKLLAGGDAATKALTRGLYLIQECLLPRSRPLAFGAGQGGQQAVINAMSDADPNIRVTAVRAAHQIKMDATKVVNQMLSDTSPAVLRELCLMLRYEPNERAIPLARENSLTNMTAPIAGIWKPSASARTDREAETLEAWQKDHANKDPKSEEGINWRLKLDYPQPPEPPARFGRRGGRGGPTTQPGGAIRHDLRRANFRPSFYEGWLAASSHSAARNPDRQRRRRRKGFPQHHHCQLHEVSPDRQ